MNVKHYLVALVTYLAIIAVPPVAAHESEVTYNRVSLTASAEREAENDLLVAILYAEHQAQRQKAVSEEVNSAIRWALDKTKQVVDVKVQTTQYNTAPIYSKKVITGWRARQSIRLESKNSEALSDLIGDLQERLSIGSINYAVSKAARDSVEETLTSDALKQFARRAELVTRDLGRKSYRIVSINVNSQGGRPQRMAYASRGMAMAADEASMAPAIEAGVQTLTVHVTGTIEVDSGSM